MLEYKNYPLQWAIEVFKNYKESHSRALFVLEKILKITDNQIIYIIQHLPLKFYKFKKILGTIESFENTRHFIAIAEKKQYYYTDFKYFLCFLRSKNFLEEKTYKKLLTEHFENSRIWTDRYEQEEAAGIPESNLSGRPLTSTNL